jgi:FAS-associated factor 2
LIPDEIRGQAGPSDGIPQRPFPPTEDIREDARQVLVRPRSRGPIAFPLSAVALSIRLVGRVIRFAGAVLNAASRRVLPRRVHRALVSLCRTLLPVPRTEDPRAAAAEFIQSFSAAYGERTPRWQINGWELAAQKAQREGLFLFVYLHSHRHEDSDRFCRDTLCSPAFVDYVNSTFVSWGGDVRSPEASRLASSLQVCKYPYCALLAFSGARTRLLTYTEGMVRPEALAESLQSTLVEHEGILWEERLIQEQRDQDRRLREEQDAEYQRSLEADRLKQQQRQQKEEEERRAQMLKEKEERIQREMQEEIERRKREDEEFIATRREEKRSLLRDEPNADADAVCVIRVRFPTGETNQRRFKMSDEFRCVVDWVESLEGNAFLKFSLATTYPRQVVGQDEYSSTLETLRFATQTALAIQPEDDDSS